MIAAPPGTPQTLAPEVVLRAAERLRNGAEREVAELLLKCEFRAGRGEECATRRGVFFLPLSLTIYAPADLIGRIKNPEILGRIRHALDAALCPPAFLAEVVLLPAAEMKGPTRASA